MQPQVEHKCGQPAVESTASLYVSTMRIGGIAGLRADVSVWVPVVQAAVGVITVVGAFFAARIGATRQDKSTQQREAADARAEWFRRLQWASELALADSERYRAAGLALLEVIEQSPLGSGSGSAHVGRLG